MKTINLKEILKNEWIKTFGSDHGGELDKQFEILLKKTIEKLYFWKFFFKKYEVKAVNISHRDYTDTNIVCKIAYQKKIKVYIFEFFTSRMLY